MKNIEKEPISQVEKLCIKSHKQIVNLYFKKITISDKNV